MRLPRTSRTIKTVVRASLVEIIKFEFKFSPDFTFIYLHIGLLINTIFKEIVSTVNGHTNCR